MKTLVFIKTHFINDFILTELEKLRKCNGESYKTILFIDNHTHFLNVDGNGVQELDFSGIKQTCFIFDEDIFKEMNFPYFTKDSNNTDLSKVMWYCCDYPFYIVNKYFPKYDYYWQIESDVFCNGDSYEVFFEQFSNNDSDFIANHYTVIPNSDKYWGCKTHFDWVYDKKLKCSCLFPIVRLSKMAVKFMYKKRLKLAKVFEKYKEDESNRWTYCENFVPTELYLNDFKCTSLYEEQIRCYPEYNIEKDIPVQIPDFKLYHPVKS